MCSQYASPAASLVTAKSFDASADQARPREAIRSPPSAPSWKTKPRGASPVVGSASCTSRSASSPGAARPRATSEPSGLNATAVAEASAGGALQPGLASDMSEPFSSRNPAVPSASPTSEPSALSAASCAIGASEVEVADQWRPETHFPLTVSYRSATDEKPESDADV